ncbi:Uncharacterised protein [uncultured archaeon]|nr:Uncharacterised protein [uncultured archaeon]
MHINIFKTLPATINPGDSLVFEVNFTNIGSAPGTFNTTITIPDSNEVINLTQTTLLVAETADLLQGYNSSLQAGTHEIYVAINTTNRSWGTTYDLTVTTPSSGGTGNSGQGETAVGGGSSSSSGSGEIVGSDQSNSSETPVNVTPENQNTGFDFTPPEDLSVIDQNKIGPQPNPVIYPVSYYIEALPKDNLGINYTVAGKDINLSNVNVSGIPDEWNYTLIKLNDILFRLNLTIGNTTNPDSAGTGPQTYAIKVQQPGVQNTAITVLTVKPSTPQGVLRRYLVDPLTGVSTMRLTFYNNENKSKIIKIVEDIPKTFANSTDDITFDVPPDIIRKDPQVSWELFFSGIGRKIFSYFGRKTSGVPESQKIKAFFSGVQIITAEYDLGELLIKVNTPAGILQGDMGTAQIDIANAGIDDVNATLNLEVTANCSVTPETMNVSVTKRDLLHYEFSINCGINSPVGEYSGKVMIEARGKSKEYDFKFIVYRSGGVALKLPLVIILAIILLIIVVISAITIVRSKKYS